MEGGFIKIWGGGILTNAKKASCLEIVTHIVTIRAVTAQGEVECCHALTVRILVPIFIQRWIFVVQ